jgi:RHS repeat-associated protein
LAVSPWEGAEQRYNIFRWYRAGWGRYTQSDPISVGGGATWGVNLLYGYAADNPTFNTDPFGMYKVEPPSGTQSEDINRAVFQVMQKLNKPQPCCGPLANKVMKVLSDPKLTFRVAPWLQGCGFSPGTVAPSITRSTLEPKRGGKGAAMEASPDSTD